MNAESSETQAEAELQAMEAELQAKTEQLDQFLARRPCQLHRWLGVGDCVWLAVTQATEGQHIGN